MRVYVNEYLTFDSEEKELFYENLICRCISESKSMTNFLLASHGFRVPDQILLDISDMSLLESFIKKIDFPICVKPDNLTESMDVFPDIKDNNELLKIIEYMKSFHERIVVEKHIDGRLFRLYCCDGKLVGATEKRRRYVIGDGVSTVEDLARKKYQYTFLEGMTKENSIFLLRQGITEKTVPKGDAKVEIGEVCTDSDFAVYFAKDIHKDYFSFVKRIEQVIKLNFFAIDIIASSLEKFNDSVFVIELQDSPEFGRGNKMADIFYESFINYVLKKQKMELCKEKKAQ